MRTTLVLCVDPAFNEKVRASAARAAATVRWVDDPSGLDQAVSLQPHTVLVDLNLPWADAVVSSIENCKHCDPPPRIIAFLDHRAGDLAIRAKLAGADRVLPRAQLESELESILGEA